MNEDELNNLSRTLSRIRESASRWKSMYEEMIKTCAMTGRERDKWRNKAEDLHARYKGALEDIETVIEERDMARAAANSFRQCAEITFGPMPFPRKFHWEANEEKETNQ
jgi:uncharacterized coiled-coil DUF342 family protein